MGYTITPSSDGKYILLKVTGDITRNLALQYNIAAHKKGRELGINRYLVDLTESRNVDTVLDSYEFAYKDMQETPGIDRSARVAVIISPGDHSHDFIETVAKNAGLDMTVFTNQDDAITHLLSERE